MAFPLAPLALVCLLGQQAIPLKKEAEDLTRLTIARFYDRHSTIWKAPEQTSEMVGTQGYTFWPSLLAWQMVIEAARIDAKAWKPKISSFFAVLERYYDNKAKAYCAWVYFPGNDDMFYDDNAWAAVACLEAYEVTGEKRYMARASEVFNSFVKKGWDSQNGGVRWGTKPEFIDRMDRTVSATAASALAGLLIDKATKGTKNRAWSKRALDWIRDNLSDKDGLIYDGFYGSTGKRMPTKWTYNAGVPIRAAVEYYRATRDRKYMDWARRMGNAACNPDLCPLYDGAVKSLEARRWYDATYFVQYLADGLWHLSKASKDNRYVAEAKRHAEYCIEYLRDSDGFYWRNMRLWTINADLHRKFLKTTGQDGPAFTPDESERSYNPEELKKPVGERKLVKTLLANAGMARMLWILARP